MRPWHEIALGTPGVHAIQVDVDGGAFWVRMGKNLLKVVASNGFGWDHVSVSLRHRTPTWAELEHVKRLFFAEDEVAMQLHVPAAKHINVHQYCLHIWRPQAEPIPLPPEWMV